MESAKPVIVDFPVFCSLSGEMKMLYSLFSKPNDNMVQDKFRRYIRLSCLLAGIFLIFAVFATAVQAETNGSVTIDPIGDHASGEKFNITGTVTIPNCKKIGIEIFPKAYWESACQYAKTDNAGRIVFMEIPSTKENFHPTGIKLMRFNPDGTQSYQELERSKDHWNSVTPVEKTTLDKKRWSIQVQNNENGTPFSPGSYHVNVWDASTQVQKHDNTLANGWDIIKQKVYPSTAMINIWDSKNEKDMQYAEFSIRR